MQQRKKYVLDVLNKGDMKDIEKLPAVGSKTAERIILYRFDCSLGHCDLFNREIILQTVEGEHKQNLRVGQDAQIP